MEVKEARMEVKNGEERLGTVIEEAHAVRERRKSEGENERLRLKKEHNIG